MSIQSKVLIVTQCFYPDVGGIEGLMTALADQCVEAGWRVTVLAERIRNKQANPPAPPSPTPSNASEARGPGGAGGNGPVSRASSKSRAAKIAGIFANSWKSVEALPSGLTIPVSVLAHGMEYPLDASPAKKRRIAVALARCDAVIANSQYTAGLVLPYLEGQDNQMQIVLPPTPPLTGPDASAMAAMKGRIGGHHPVIATVARLEPRKGTDAVIRAMPEVLRQHPHCLYAIAAPAPIAGRLEELARSLNVQQAVVFLGRVSEAEKPALLAQSGCLCHAGAPRRPLGRRLRAELSGGGLVRRALARRARWRRGRCRPRR